MAATAGVLVAVVAMGIVWLRLSRLPPLLAWDGPDASAGTRPTELRLIEAAGRAPHDAQAQLALGQFYLEDARPFEALWALRDAHRLDPNAAKPRLLMARAMVMGQLYQPAVALLQAVLQDHPDDVESARELAQMQLSLGRPAEASATLRAAERRGPLQSEAILLLGRALEAAGRDQEALAQYSRYQQAEPKSAAIYLRIGRVLARTGKEGDAERAFRAVQVLDPRSPEPYYSQGLIALGRGPDHEAAARQSFAMAVGTDERYAPAHLQIAAYYQRRGQWEWATNVLQRVLQIDPENAEAALRLSQVKQVTGDAAGASYFRGLYCDLTQDRPKATAQYRALAAIENSARGFLLLSQGYVSMDQKAKAAEATRQGLRRHPDDVELRERLIAIDLLTGNLKEAEQLCRDWMRSDPSAVHPIGLLGRIRLLYNDRKGAMKLFEQVARAEPQNAESPFGIGSVYADKPSRENWEMAARYYGKAVTLKPDSSRFHYNLGIALQNLNRLEGARRQFLRAMDLDIHQTAPMNNVVQVARQMKQLDQVEFWAPLVRDVEQRLREELPAWKRVWDDPQDAAGYLPLARFLERTGELRKARGVLEQAVALQPDQPDWRRELAMLRRTLDLM